MSPHRIILSIVLLCTFAPTVAADETVIEIAALDRATPVDFQTEVLPILRQNCLACHSKTKREGDLVLESAADLLTGGASGAAAEPGKGEESLLLMRASGQSDDLMPPQGNSVAAKNLTPEELGLIKLWIDQGAVVESTLQNKIAWQPLPPGMNSIYAVSLTRDGQYVACGRANQVFIYHVPTGKLVGRLTDPALLTSGVYSQPGVAHLDAVNALACSPSGDLLASGGFQEIKLWRRPRNVVAQSATLPGAARRIFASPDGAYLAVASSGSADVQLWRTGGMLERTFSGHTQPINDVRFTHDGARLVTAAQDTTVRVWNLADGAPIGTLNLPQPATAIAFVAADSQVAVASGDNAVRLYALPAGPEAVAGEPLATWEGHGQPVAALATVGADGNQVLSGSADGTMRLWQVGSGQQRQFDHGGPVAAVAVRPDGARFASTGPNGIVKLWNAADGAMIAELKGDLHADLLAKSRERELTLAKGRVTDRQNALNTANELIKSETEAQKKVAEEQTKAQQARDASAAAATAAQEAQSAADKLVAEAMAALAIAQESRTTVDALLTEAQKSSQKVAETVAVAEAARAAAPDVVELQAAKVASEGLLAQARQLEAAIEASKSPLDQGVAGTQTRVNQLTEDAKTKTKAAQDAVAAAQAAETALTAAMKSVEASNGSLAKAQAAAPLAEQQIATAQEQSTAAEAASETARQAAVAKQLPFTSVAFSPDNALVVAAGEDHVIHTWSAETGAPCDTYASHSGAVSDLTFVGDSRLASVAVDDPRWLVWDLFPAWTLERTISGPDKFVDRVLALDFSPDGALLASGGGEPSRGGELKLWNVADGAHVREIPDAHSDTVFCVRFSPDGQQMASCGADKFLKVFNVADGAWVRSFEGHTHHVLGLAWRADGKVIASASADNSIKVWDAQNGDQLRTIGGFGKEVTSIEFIAEGTEVLASSGDRTVRWFNTADGANSRNFGGGGDFMYTAAAVPDGSLVVAGGQDSVLRLWKGADAAEVRQFAPPEASK